MRWFQTPKTRHTVRSVAPVRPAVEQLEAREVPAAFVGRAYFDANSDGLFNAGDTPLAGAQVDLFVSGQSVPLQTQIVGSDGVYRFTGLAAGAYQIVETPPAGFVNRAANTENWSLGGATPVQPNAINVTVSATPYHLTDDGSGDESPVLVNLGGSTYGLFAGELNVTLSGGGLLVPTSTVTYCLTLDLELMTADVTPRADFVPSDLPGVAQLGRIGYLYNKYGNSFNTPDAAANAANAAALQLALWELVYDTIDNTTGAGSLEANSGTFFLESVVPGAPGDLTPDPVLTAEIKAKAYAFLAESAGQSEPVILLDGPTNGSQLTLISGSLDFGNIPDSTISGTKFNDANGDGIRGTATAEPGVGGVTIELYRDVNEDGALTAADGGPIATKPTNPDGTYTFAGLAAGKYLVKEIVPVDSVQTFGPDVYAITLGTDADATGFDFGNYRNPEIDIEKTTNGPSNTNTTAPNYDNEDTADGAGVPILTPGTSVTWTYQVTNTGTVPFTTAEVVVTDDNGTPDDTSDDITPTLVLSSDAGGDGILSPDEVWLYTATGTVQAIPGASTGPAVTFNFEGNSALDDTDGNVRTFTAGGVAVQATAFSREKSNGAWAPAWLGRYGGGLGVTDSGEGNGSDNTHTVDNVGRDNYILLVFDQTVVVDLVTLGYVVGDSDLKVWIGTIPGAFGALPALSDSVLADLGFSEVSSGGGSTRTADLNAGNVVGNVLVIAAKPGDADDKFKVKALKVQPTEPGVYANKATVTVPGDSDCDLSHYTNPPSPPPPPGGTISGTKYRDVSGNGLNLTDSTTAPKDTPLGGVTIYLDRNNNGKLDSGDISTETLADGTYTFTGLSAGTYYVREVVPTGWLRTAPALTDVYTVTIGSSTPSSTGNDFANFETVCSECTLTCVSFKIVHTDGTSEVVNDLRGQTREGDLITVTFTIDDPGTFVVSFVSYTAPDPFFDANRAGLQQIYDLATGTFSYGQTGSLTISVPNSYYQVDFVCGYVIDRLGPAGSNIFYTPQDRLFSADNNGNHAPVVNAGSISGVKYKDTNGDGDRDTGEVGLGKWVIYIDANNNNQLDANERATVTRADGSYKISNVPAGTYKVREVQQAGWTQTEAPGSVGVTASTNTGGIDFGNKPASPGSISGYKFNDRNADGEWDKNGLDNKWNNSDDEVGLCGWTIFVDYDGDGYRDANEPYDVTDSSGYYKITGVAAGAWEVAEVMQSGWVRTTDERVVTLTSGEAETNVTFGNFRGNLVMSGDTATVGFWKGVNGQKLIKSLNGGGTYGTNTYALGNWLAANFPEMYGSGCGSNNMTGKSNAQVASYFSSLANNSSKQLEAQVLATVLSVYVTDADWAGGNYAARYGFNVTSTGVKNDHYNVGDNGAAFGAVNDSALTVWDILQRTNDRARDGMLWYGCSSSLKSMAQVVYVGINTAGGITS